MRSSTIKYESMLAAGFAFLKEGNPLEASIRFARITTKINYDVWSPDRDDDHKHAFDMSLFGDLVTRIVSEGDCTNNQIRQLARTLELGGAIAITDDELIPVRRVDQLSILQMHVIKRAGRVSALNRHRLAKYVLKYLDTLSK